MAQTLTLARPARNLRPYLWLALPLLVLATLFFYPLLLIAEQALRDASGNLSLETFWQVIDSKRFIGALLNTLQIAVFATLGCLVLGSVLALILVFIPFPGSQLVSRVIDTFIALPTFLITLAFTFIYGSAGLLNGTLMALFAFELPPVDFLYSINGVILAEITVFTPLVMRPLMAGLRQIDKSQLEAASILGAHPLRVITQVIFPAALPALMAGGSLCLLLTTNEFGIVLFIGAKGVNTLPMMVYSKAILESDYSVACMIALINILLSLGLFMLYRLAALEQVLEWNPQVIFVQDRYPQVVKQIENDPQWQTIDAVKHHRVWLMPEYAKAWGYPMPEALALGELWMAKKLYPARYQSIDVDSKARDYYQRFYRVAWTPDAR